MANDKTLTYTLDDILRAYCQYDASNEAKEPILYFLSDLTGLSIDALLERL